MTNQNFRIEASTAQCCSVPCRHWLQFLRPQHYSIQCINKRRYLFISSFIIREGQTWQHKFQEAVGERVSRECMPTRWRIFSSYASISCLSNLDVQCVSTLQYSFSPLLSSRRLSKTQTKAIHNCQVFSPISGHPGSSSAFHKSAIVYLIFI